MSRQRGPGRRVISAHQGGRIRSRERGPASLQQGLLANRSPAEILVHRFEAEPYEYWPL